MRDEYRMKALAAALLGGHIPVNVIVAAHLPRWTFVIPVIAIVTAVYYLILAVISPEPT